SYPGFYALTPPGDAAAYGVYWPTSVPAGLVSTQVVIDGEPVWSGSARAEPTLTNPPDLAQGGPSSNPPPARATPPASTAPPDFGAPTARAALGTIVGARSGDKGGNANLGVWVRTDTEYAWLEAYLTAERLAELLPSIAELPVARHCLPNLFAINFVIAGLLGRGVAASTRLDPQAKALGEELRAALAEVPVALLPPSISLPQQADQRRA